MFPAERVLEREDGEPKQPRGYVGPTKVDILSEAMGSGAYICRKSFDFIDRVFKKEYGTLEVSRFYHDRKTVVDFLDSDVKVELQSRLRRVFQRHGFVYVPLEETDQTVQSIRKKIKAAVALANEYLAEHPIPPTFVEVPGIRSDGSGGLVKMPSPDIDFEGHVHTFGGDEAIKDVSNALVERAVFTSDKNALRDGKMTRVLRRPFPRVGQTRPQYTKFEKRVLGKKEV